MHSKPLNYNNKDYVLSQYDQRLLEVKNNEHFDPEIIKQWKLEALDKFMVECGDATLYTATVSQYFTIPELIAIKHFMYKHDTRRLLQMAHQRFEQTGLPQWKHDSKWNHYCQICQSRQELFPEINIK